MGKILIETVEVGSGGAASIEFTSIPQDGVHLLALVSVRSTSTQMQINLNGSSAAFSGIRLFGNGSAVTSGTETVEIGNWSATTDTSSTFGNASIYIPNYTSSENKSIATDSIRENNATGANQVLNSTVWSNTAPITSLWLGRVGQTIQQYSSVSLYKITAD